MHVPKDSGHQRVYIVRGPCMCSLSKHATEPGGQATSWPGVTHYALHIIYDDLSADYNHNNHHITTIIIITASLVHGNCDLRCAHGKRFKCFAISRTQAGHSVLYNKIFFLEGGVTTGNTYCIHTRTYRVALTSYSYGRLTAVQCR